MAEINKKVYELGGQVRLLGRISWPRHCEQEFLKKYSSGIIEIPKIQYDKADQSNLEFQLKVLKKSFSAHDPIEKLTKKTINSFLETIELTKCVGTEHFTKLSKKIFGKPTDIIPGSQVTNLEAAQKIMDITSEFSLPIATDYSRGGIDAKIIKSYLDRRIEGVFKGHGPSVNIVNGLAPKATATATCIKIREGCSFTHYDFKQLFYHEVMTHSLTSINGEKQPIMKCLGRSTLRTLETQEGLATFSEIITGAMDLHRLRRLALRTIGINMALNGASFLDIFEFFNENGQGENESFNSAHRIFRGGYPGKNIIFTKDSVYLGGLLKIHTFFRWAMKNNKLELCHLLFSGKLALSDLFELEEAYRYQLIAPPQFLPAWFSKIEGLAGILSFSLVANLIKVDTSIKDIDWVA